MKRIILLILLAFGLTVQAQEDHTGKVRLLDVGEGTKADKIIVRGEDKALKQLNFLDEVKGERSYFEQITMDVSLVSNSTASVSEPQLLDYNSMFYRVYRRDLSKEHVSSEGKIYMQKSADKGASWGGEELVYEDLAFDCRNIVFGEILGDLYVFFRKYNVSISENHSIGYIKSTDDGVSWSSYTTISLSEIDTAVDKDVVPFGKIMKNGNTYYVSFYGNLKNEWLRTVDGSIFVSDGSKYNVDLKGINPVEPFYNFIDASTVVGLIRNEQEATDAAHYIVISNDGGSTFTSPTITNLANKKYLRTAPYFYYDETEGLFLSIAVERYNPNGNKIFVYANTVSEILVNPQNFRLISTQDTQFSYSEQSYGYPNILKVSTDKYVVNYVERYLFNGDQEVANLFQFYISKNIGNTKVSPTVKEFPRVLSHVGNYESRNIMASYDFNPVIQGLTVGDVDKLRNMPNKVLGANGLQNINIGGGNTIDVANQPSGSVGFGNYASSLFMPVINMKSSNGYSILQSSTSDLNSFEDFTFSIRGLDGNDYTDFTKGGFAWVRYSTQLMKLTRQGDLITKEGVFAKNFNGLKLTDVEATDNADAGSKGVAIGEFYINSTTGVLTKKLN